MLKRENSIFYAYVADYQSTALLPATGTKVTNANLPEGTVAIVDGELEVIATLPSTGQFRVVKSWGPYKDLEVSAPFDAANTTLVMQEFTRMVQQVTYIGYSPSTLTENIPFANSTSYYIHVEKQDNDAMNRSGQAASITAQWKTGASATDDASAAAAHKALLKNLSKEPNKYLKVERVGDGTPAALSAGSATLLKFTKGSKTVAAYVKAAADNSSVTASTASVAAAIPFHVPSSDAYAFTFTALILGTAAGRHVVYIGETAYVVADAGSAAQNADAIAAAINAGSQATATVSTATVTIVYNECIKALPPLVMSQTADGGAFSNVAVTVTGGNAVPTKYLTGAAVTTAATFELDVPFQGETGYAWIGTTVNTNTGIASASNTIWGLKFTGIRNPFDTAHNRDFYVNNFSVKCMSEGEKAAEVTYHTKAYHGFGNFENVSWAEYMSSGHTGTGRAILGTPPGVRNSSVTSCSRYSLISFREKAPVEGLTNTQFNSTLDLYVKLSPAGKLPSGSLGDELLGVVGGSTADLDI